MINPRAQIIHLYNVAQAPSITPPTVAASAENRGAETWKRWTFATAPFLVTYFFLVSIVALVRFKMAHPDDDVPALPAADVATV